MKLYTSYWAQVRNFPQNLVGLNTTVWPPKWRPLGKDNRGVLVIDCPPLRPGRACNGLCTGKCVIKHPDTCSFLHTYYKQLTQINFENFMESLEKLHDKICVNEQLSDVDFALIVYETPLNECSERKMLQRWIKENGLQIEEWSIHS